MSGVWVFKNGVVRLVENPGGEASEGRLGNGGKKTALAHVPTNQLITSYDMLESKLRELGWELYRSDAALLQFHKHSSVHLISLPSDFNKLKSVHMYDIVVKTRNVFEVRDV